MRGQRGFTLVELIAVMILTGILAATASSALLPSSQAQLQASRDRVVAAFFSAQQLAMTRTSSTVQLVVSAPNQIDIRLNGASTRAGGEAYPLTLRANQTLSPAIHNFDRLGRTSANTLVLAQGGASVNISVSASGYVY